jgi:hypothetical protein
MRLLKELRPKVVAILKIRRTRVGRERAELKLKRLLKNNRLVKE